MFKGSRKTVLIVEDEELTRKLLRAYLISKGCAVHLESHGRTALSHATTHQPDLVILDASLPDMSGYEVCKKLRVLYRTWAVPILMISEMDKPIDQLRGYSFGADAYLSKPFQLEQIEDTINFLLGRTPISR